LVSRQLAQIAADDIAMRVEEAVRALLVKGPPRREEVARALATSDRTLERRLHKRGLTFQHIVDETRRRLARQLLARPDTSNAEIAYLLGFTEQSVFFRACRRWFNASPGQVRRSIRCDAGNELATKAKD
jgi:AraC-like DNA-binding protein